MAESETSTEFGSGPLSGVRVLDLSALGPGPFCSMLLADACAEVIAVERPSAPQFDPAKYLSRGKRSVIVDLRAAGGSDVITRLADRADVLIESNRPGTMERRGLGPDVLCERNPRLIYARLTGWGQDGPYRSQAGHDINYLAISGALGVLGGANGNAPPPPPLGMLGDIAGGALFCALGITMALYERNLSGRGQVIDSAIVDGSALINTPQLGEFANGAWPGSAQHILSGMAPFYGVYRCSDGRDFAVGAIEPKFHRSFVQALGLTDLNDDNQFDASQWPERRRRVAHAFAREPRSYWEFVFADIDACGTPVLGLDELAHDGHLKTRGTIVESDGVLSASPAPRFSAHRARIRPQPVGRGYDTAGVLGESGFTAAEIEKLAADRTVFLGTASNPA